MATQATPRSSNPMAEVHALWQKYAAYAGNCTDDEAELYAAQYATEMRDVLIKHGMARRFDYAGFVREQKNAFARRNA